MTVEEIERLLAEFYEGNTNEQEEELLKEAFRTEEVPEHLQKDKKLFLSFFPGKVVDNVPAGLVEKTLFLFSLFINQPAQFIPQARRNFHISICTLVKAKKNFFILLQMFGHFRCSEIISQRLFLALGSVPLIKLGEQPFNFLDFHSYSIY